MTLRALIASNDQDLQDVGTELLRQEFQAEVQQMTDVRLWEHPDLLQGAGLLILDSDNREFVQQMQLAWTNTPDLNVLLTMDSAAAGSWLDPYLQPGKTDILTKPLVLSVLRHRLRTLGTLSLRLNEVDEVDEVDETVLGVRVMKELHGPTGRLNAQALAKMYGLSLRSLSPVVNVSAAALHKTPDSEKVQPLLQDLREIMTLLLDVVETREYARAWLNSRHPDLGLQAPIELIKQNQVSVVLNFLRASVMGLPG